MTTLTMSCDRCTENINLDVGCLLLAVVSDDDERGRLAYLCPACHEFVVIFVSLSTATTLLAAGCSCMTVDANLPNPESAPDGAPLTIDDLIDMHTALVSDDWMAELTAGQS